MNVKPSRLGGLESLCAAYDYCEEHGIGAYGGGQTELGVGRDHIQYLAATFHPDTPNDTAPRGFNQNAGAGRAAHQPARGARGRHRLPIPGGRRP